MSDPWESRPIIMGARCGCGKWLGKVQALVKSDHVGQYVAGARGTCKRHGEQQALADYDVWWTGEAGLNETFAATADGHKP